MQPCYHQKSQVRSKELFEPCSTIVGRAVTRRATLGRHARKWETRSAGGRTRRVMNTTVSLAAYTCFRSLISFDGTRTSKKTSEVGPSSQTWPLTDHAIPVRHSATRSADPGSVNLHGIIQPQRRRPQLSPYTLKQLEILITSHQGPRWAQEWIKRDCRQHLVDAVKDLLAKRCMSYGVIRSVIP